MPVTINGTTGIAGPDGSASTPAVQGTDANTGLFYPAADTVALSTGGTERMRILSGGKVLINATTDRDKWDNSTIGSNLLQVERSASGGNSSISVTNNPGTFADAFSLLYLGRSRGTANNDYTAVASGDGLGVVSFQGADGTEFVEAASIRGYVDGTPGANDMPGRLMFFTTPDGSATPAERMRIDSSGNVLVGKTSLSDSTVGIQLRTQGVYVVGCTSSGSEALMLNRNTSDGTIASIKRGNTEVGTISVTTSATAYNTSSDYRLKENVQPMTNALATVAQLNPVTYTWKSTGEAGQGFIAHELQAVVPDAVTGEKDAIKTERVEVSPAVSATYDEEGNELTPAVEAVFEDREVPDYQGVDTSFLVATLTAAIQELKAIVDAQAARISALEAA